jgi:predicted nuclease with TOPRIM domain
LTVNPRTGYTAKETHEIKERLRYIAGELERIDRERDRLRAEYNTLRGEQAQLNAKVYRA